MEAGRFTVSRDDENTRIDRFLAENQDELTRSGLEKLFDFGKIHVNGKSKTKNYKLKNGDKIEILKDENPVKTHVKSQDLPLEISYEDKHLLVVNKAKGMIVHPSSPEDEGTLVNALLFYLGENLSPVGGELRPGIVHRIDKDTSGLLVVAKTDGAYEKLAEQVEAHTMLRRYEGIVHGRINNDEGVIDAPIGRHPVRRTKNCVRENARHAVTHYRVLSRFDKFTHVEFTLETGRTHQIRVHMAHIGHPLAGDGLYGSVKPIKALRGQCLHAGTLAFTHPVTGERLKFFAELPPYFVDFLRTCIHE